MGWADFATTALQIGGSIYAANQAGKAATNAGNAAAAGAEGATQLQREIYNHQTSLNMPFYQGGLGAYNQYLALMGLPQQQASSTTGSFGGQQPGASMQWLASGAGTPAVNQTLYNSDPAYRQAWDQALAEHQRQFGSGYTKRSSAGAIESRLQQLYGQFKPQTVGGSPAMRTGGNTPATPTGGGTPASPMSQQQAFAAFRNTPGYQFGLNEGNKQIQASAAAGGGLMSGRTLKALQRYGNDYADQQGYTPYMNRLAGLFGGAQTASGNIGSAGQNFGNQAGANMQNAANARASGIMGAGQARQQGYQNAAGFLGQYYGNNNGWGG